MLARSLAAFYDAPNEGHSHFMAPTAITLQLIMAQLACGLLGIQQCSAPSPGHDTCLGLECSHSQQLGGNGGGLAPCSICCSPRVGSVWGTAQGSSPGCFAAPAFPIREARLHRRGRDGGARLPPLAAGGRAGATPPLPSSSSAAGRFAEVLAERGRSPSPPPASPALRAGPL